MAIRKRRTSKKTAAPARRRRIMAAPARRTTRRKSTGGGKFDIMQNIVLPMAGAGIGIIAGNAISKMVPQIPMGKALIPLGLSFVAGTMLKQPALAAGMAAAGGIALLNQVSPTMFADESLNFLNEEPVPMIDFSDDSDYQPGANFEMLQAYNDELAEGGTIQYDANNNPLVMLPDGTLQYI
jgi:hypothetical protein